MALVLGGFAFNPTGRTTHMPDTVQQIISKNSLTGSNNPHYGIAFPSNLTMTQSKIQVFYPFFNATIENYFITSGSGYNTVFPIGPTVKMKNNFFIDNYSMSLINNTAIPVNELGWCQLDLGGTMYVNNTLFDTATAWWQGITFSGPAVFSHDYFPYMIYLNPNAPWQIAAQTSKPVNYQDVSFILSNSTFGYSYFDPSSGEARFIEASSGWFTQFNFLDANPNHTAWSPQYTLSHDTFKAYMTGNSRSANYYEPSVVGFMQGNTTNILEDSLFLNSPKFTLPAKYSFYQPPFSTDVYITYPHAPVTIKGNYFLNLTNQTVPIAAGSESGGMDNWQYKGYQPTAYIENNKFYMRSIDQVYGPNGAYSHNPISNASFDPYTDKQTISYMGYEIPMLYNMTIVSTNQWQYTFNTSTLQYYTGAGVPVGWPKWAYSWEFAPDVNVSSGTPTISYSNGLVGGPQPNFTWDGYKYTESVEPSYIQIGANSTKAPPINLQFNGVPNAAYVVAMYDNGQLVNRTNVLSDSNGVVTFSYNPATMPLDPTFALVPPPNQPDPNVTSLLTIMAIAIGLGLLVWALAGRRR